LYHIAVNSESNVNIHNNMQHKTARYFVTSYVQVKMYSYSTFKSKCWTI